MEKMVHLDYLEFLERWVLEDSLVPEDLMACLDHQAYLDLKVLLDQKEMKVRQGHQAPLDRLAIKVQWVHQDLLVLWVHLAKLDQEENLDYLVSLELMVYQARMEHLEKPDLKETKVLKVILVL